MTKSIALVVLAAGIVLLILGFIEYDSTSSDISRFFTGSANDKSEWLLLAGAVACIGGIAGLLRGAKTA